MAEKPRPQAQPKPTTKGHVRNGQVKDKPSIDKTAVLPPPPTKPKN